MLMSTAAQTLQQGRSAVTLERVAQLAEDRLIRIDRANSVNSDNSDRITVSSADNNYFFSYNDINNLYGNETSYRPYQTINSVNVPTDRLATNTDDEPSVDIRVNNFIKEAKKRAEACCPYEKESDQYEIWMHGFLKAAELVYSDCKYGSEDDFYSSKIKDIRNDNDRITEMLQKSITEETEKQLKSVLENGITPVDEAVEEDGIDIEVEEEEET